MDYYRNWKEDMDKEQEEFLKNWNAKQKLKKNKRKERIDKIKEFIYGKKAL